MVLDIEDAKRAAGKAQTTARGLMRVTVPVSIDTTVPPAIVSPPTARWIGNLVRDAEHSDGIECR